MEYSSILYEKHGDVVFLRLNEPDSLNAMSAAISEQLLGGFMQAQQEARCIVIGSTGRAFCSGANLSDGSLDVGDPDRDIGAGVEAVINPLVSAISTSRVPVITAMRGAAAGVGCGIACAGDIIVAGEGAYFFFAFGKVGLGPDAGTSYFLAKTLGRVRAMEMMLLSRKLPARQAMEWGLINRVVPDDDVDATALDLATKLASGPRSLGMIRKATWAAVDSPLDAQLALERNLQRDAGRTDDFLEGVTAFQERRAPHFTGR